MSSSWMFGTIRAAGPARPHEIVKIGGSLLSLESWPARLSELVRDRASRRPVLLVVGGGPIVDGLRRIDAAGPVRPAAAHELAIDLMGTTARLVAEALGLRLVQAPDRDAAVLDTPRWLSTGGRLARLPVGWHVTSDSLAAAIATATGGGLLMAKRTPPPTCPAADPLPSLSLADWVDGHFPVAAADLTEIAWAAPASIPAPRVGGPALERGGPGGG